MFNYCQRQLGVVPNEMFGQTEINYIVGNCARFWPPRPGSMGMGYPGHRVAVRDAEGYLWYQGRSDDVFKAAGYRIGPGEIENCLVKHPGVANAAVVPKPDAERGAVVKAYVVIAPDLLARCGAAPQALAQLQQRLTLELQAHVRGLLAPYEYPKEIEFVEALPMTTTGKVQRRVLRLQEEARARHGCDLATLADYEKSSTWAK